MITLKKLPNGISNYEELITQNYIYVDKTPYIEKLENLSDKRIMFLRPRKFGKTLFTSTLENYYDILKQDQFETLFSNTYIGKNPTPNKNKYHILRFNFSGIDTSSYEATIKGFKNSTIESIKAFIAKYKIDFYINKNQGAEEILNSLITAFSIQKKNQRIYVIIDEYDHFANELLGFRTDDFKNLLEKNGKIRKWYEILKKGTESVIDRIFITGVAPITLDSTTSGFNIATDITRDINFNNMLGFTKEEVKYLMNELEIPEEEQEKILPIVKINYDGYIFSDELENGMEQNKIYNSNMTIYFLKEYIKLNKIPQKLVDTNIISDYKKIESIINLCKNMQKTEILRKIVEGKYIQTRITEKFNTEISFNEKELVSLLFYLGYLTIKNNELGISELGTPNDVISQIYSEYFLKYITEQAQIEQEIDIINISKEILFEGKIEKITKLLEQYLSNLSNRDYQKFDEKYIKVIFYSISKMLGTIYVKSEQELGGKYADILLLPKERIEERYSILIEFKYIKQEEYEKNNELLEQKQQEAKEQIKQYAQTEEIKAIPKLKKYTIVVIKDKLYITEV